MTAPFQHTPPSLFRLLFLFSLAILQSPSLFSETLTVATYNVANYTLTNRQARGTYLKNYPKPEKEKQALRVNIKALNADIIAIQEMGPRPFLDELLADLKTEGADYPYGEVLEFDGDLDRHVAIISRRPFSKVAMHTDLTFKYFGQTDIVKRGLLEAHVQTEAGELTLFVVHLKSRITDRADDPESTIRRSGEAEAVRNRVLRIFPSPSAPESRFIILGDCNDNRASRPLRALCQRGKTEIASDIPAKDSRGEVWTHFFQKEDSYTRIDHILVSPALKAAVAKEGAKIYDGPLVREASDHRPVFVQLNLNSAQKSAK